MSDATGERDRAASAGRWFSAHGLVLRVVAFLTIALMPIGLIAIYQTAEFQRETLRRSELSLLALTAQAGAPVEQTIERAFGVAEALGVVIDELDDPASCSSYLDRYIEGRRLYAMIGLVDPDGTMRCSSLDRPLDMRETGIWEQLRLIWVDLDAKLAVAQTTHFSYVGAIAGPPALEDPLATAGPDACAATLFSRAQLALSQAIHGIDGVGGRKGGIIGSCASVGCIGKGGGGTCAGWGACGGKCAGGGTCGEAGGGNGLW